MDPIERRLDYFCVDWPRARKHFLQNEHEEEKMEGAGLYLQVDTSSLPNQWIASRQQSATSIPFDAVRFLVRRNDIQSGLASIQLGRM